MGQVERLYIADVILAAHATLTALIAPAIWQSSKRLRDAAKGDGIDHDHEAADLDERPDRVGGKSSVNL